MIHCFEALEKPHAGHKCNKNSIERYKTRFHKSISNVLLNV